MWRGAPDTAKTNLELSLGCPLATYIKEGREEVAELMRRIMEDSMNTQVDQVNLLAVCGAPSTDFHLGHIVVVLRRSPALVTSSSPSPCRRADGTLPRPQLDLEFKGHHRAEREQIAEVPCVRYLISWIAKTFNYINRVT